MSAARDYRKTQPQANPDSGVLEGQSISLEAVSVPPGHEQQDRIPAALRLLATWAVRAARPQDPHDDTETKGARR